MSTSTKPLLTVGLIFAAIVLAVLAITLAVVAQTPTYVPLDPSEWTPLNNGYPGWSNKVQPW